MDKKERAEYHGKENEMRGMCNEKRRRRGHRIMLGLFSFLFLVSAALTAGLLLPKERAYDYTGDGLSDPIDTISTTLGPPPNAWFRLFGVNDPMAGFGIFGFATGFSNATYKNEPIIFTVGEPRAITLGDIFSAISAPVQFHTTSIDWYPQIVTNLLEGSHMFVTTQAEPTNEQALTLTPEVWTQNFTSIITHPNNNPVDLYQTTVHDVGVAYSSLTDVVFSITAATNAPLMNTTFYLWIANYKGTISLSMNSCSNEAGSDIFYIRIPIIIGAAPPIVSNNPSDINAGSGGQGKTTRIYMNGTASFSGGPNYGCADANNYAAWTTTNPTVRQGFDLNTSDINTPRRNIYIDSVTGSSGWGDALASLTVGGNPGNTAFCPTGGSDGTTGSTKKGYYIELTPKAFTDAVRTATLTIVIKQIAASPLTTTVTVTVTVESTANNTPVIGNSTLSVDAGSGYDGKTTRIYMNGENSNNDGGTDYSCASTDNYATWGAGANNNGYTMGAYDPNEPKRGIYIESATVTAGTAANLVDLTISGNKYYVEFRAAVFTGAERTLTLSIEIKQTAFTGLENLTATASITVTVGATTHYAPKAGSPVTDNGGGTYSYAITTSGVSSATGSFDLALTSVTTALTGAQSTVKLNFTEDGRNSVLTGTANELYFQSLIVDVSSGSKGAYTNYVTAAFASRTTANQGVLRITPLKRTGSTPVVIRVYINDGRDGQSASSGAESARASLEISITVPNSAPVAPASPLTAVSRTVTDGVRDIALTEVALDADGDTLTFTAAEIRGHQYIGYFSAQVISDGSAVRITPLKKMASAATANNLTLTVSDGAGGTYEAQLKVTVTNSAPVAAASKTLTFTAEQVAAGRWVNKNVLDEFATDIDNTNDATADILQAVSVTYSAYQSLALADGDFIEIKGSNGGAVNNAAALGFRPLHATPAGGIQVSIVIKDDAGVQCTAVVTIIINNSAPVSKNYTSTAELQIGVPGTGTGTEKIELNAGQIASDKDVPSAPSAGIAELYDRIYFCDYNVSPAGSANKVSVTYVDDGRNLSITAVGAATEAITVTVYVIDARSGTDLTGKVWGTVTVNRIYGGSLTVNSGTVGLSASNPLELVIEQRPGDANHSTSRTYSAGDAATAASGSAAYDTGVAPVYSTEGYITAVFSGSDLDISAVKSTHGVLNGRVTVQIRVKNTEDAGVYITITIYVKVLNTYIKSKSAPVTAYNLKPGTELDVMASVFAYDTVDGDAIFAVRTDYATTGSGQYYSVTPSVTGTAWNTYFGITVVNDRGTGLIFRLKGLAVPAGGVTFTVGFYLTDTGAENENDLNVNSVKGYSITVSIEASGMSNPPVGTGENWPQGINPAADSSTASNGRFITVKSGDSVTLVLNNKHSYDNSSAYTAWVAQPESLAYGFMRLTASASITYTGDSEQYVLARGDTAGSAAYNFTGSNGTGAKSIKFDTLTVMGLSRTPGNDTFTWHSFRISMQAYNEDGVCVGDTVYTADIYFRVTNSAVTGSGGSNSISYTLGGAGGLLYAVSPAFNLRIKNEHVTQTVAAPYITVSDGDALDSFVFYGITGTNISTYADITIESGGGSLRIAPKLRTKGLANDSLEFTVKIRDSYTNCAVIADSYITVTISLTISNSTPVAVENKVLTFTGGQKNVWSEYNVVNVFATDADYNAAANRDNLKVTSLTPAAYNGTALADGDFIEIRNMSGGLTMSGTTKLRFRPLYATPGGGINISLVIADDLGFGCSVTVTIIIQNSLPQAAANGGAETITMRVTEETGTAVKSKTFGVWSFATDADVPGAPREAVAGLYDSLYFVDCTVTPADLAGRISASISSDERQITITAGNTVTATRITITLRILDKRGGGDAEEALTCKIYVDKILPGKPTVKPGVTGGNESSPLTLTVNPTADRAGVAASYTYGANEVAESAVSATDLEFETNSITPSDAGYVSAEIINSNGQLRITASKSTHGLPDGIMTVRATVRSKTDTAMRLEITVYVKILNTYLEAAAAPRARYDLTPNTDADVLSGHFASDNDGDAISALTASSGYSGTAAAGYTVSGGADWETYFGITLQNNVPTPGVLFVLSGKQKLNNRHFTVTIYLTDAGALKPGVVLNEYNVKMFAFDVYVYANDIAGPTPGGGSNWPNGADPGSDSNIQASARFVTVQSGEYVTIVINNEASKGQFGNKWFAKPSGGSGVMRLAADTGYNVTAQAGQYISVTAAPSSSDPYNGTRFDTLTVTGLSRTPGNEAFAWLSFQVFLVECGVDGVPVVDGDTYAVNVYFRVTNGPVTRSPNGAIEIGLDGSITADAAAFDVGIINKKAEDAGKPGQLGGAAYGIEVSDNDLLDIFSFVYDEALSQSIASISKYAGISWGDNGRLLRITPRLKTSPEGVAFTVKIRDTYTDCNEYTEITVTVRLYITNAAPILKEAEITAYGGYGETFNYKLSSLVTDVDTQKLTAPVTENGVNWRSGDFDFRAETLAAGYDIITPVLPENLPANAVWAEYNPNTQTLTLTIKKVITGVNINARVFDVTISFGDGTVQSAAMRIHVDIETKRPTVKNPLPAFYISASATNKVSNPFGYDANAAAGTLEAQEFLYNSITIKPDDIAVDTNGGLAMEIVSVNTASLATSYTSNINAKIVGKDVQLTAIKSPESGDGTYEMKIRVANGDKDEYGDKTANNYIFITVEIKMIALDAQANARSSDEIITTGEVIDIPLASYGTVNPNRPQPLYTSLNLNDEIKGEGEPEVGGFTGAGAYVRAEFVPNSDKTKSVLRLTGLKKLPVGSAAITVKARVSTSAQRAKKASNGAVATVNVRVKNYDLKGAESVNKNPDPASGVTYEGGAFKVTVDSRKAGVPGYAVTDIPMNAFINDNDITSAVSLAAASEYYTLSRAGTDTAPINAANSQDSAAREYGITPAPNGKAVRITGRYATGGDGVQVDFYVVDNKIDAEGNPAGEEGGSEKVKITLIVTVKNTAPTAKANLSGIVIGGFKNDETTLSIGDLADDIDIATALDLQQPVRDSLLFARGENGLYAKIIRSNAQPTAAAVAAAEVSADNGYIRIEDGGEAATVKILKRPAAANERTFWIVLFAEDSYGARGEGMLFRVNLQNSALAPNEENVTVENGMRKYSAALESGFSAVINLSDIISDPDYDDVVKYTYSTSLETGDGNSGYKCVVSDDGKSITLTMKRTENGGEAMKIGPFTVSDDGGGKSEHVYFISLTLLNTAPVVKEDYKEKTDRYDASGDTAGLHGTQAVSGRTVIVNASDIAFDINGDAMEFSPDSFILRAGNNLFSGDIEQQIAAHPKFLILTSNGKSGMLDFTIKVTDKQLQNGVSKSIRILVLFAATASDANMKSGVSGLAINTVNLAYEKAFNTSEIFYDPFGIRILSVEYGKSNEYGYSLNTQNRTVKGIAAGESTAYVTFDSAGETRKISFKVIIRDKAKVEAVGGSDEIILVNGNGNTEHNINELLRSPDDIFAGNPDSVRILDVRTSDKGAVTARIDPVTNKLIVEPKADAKAEDKITVTVTVVSGEGSSPEEFTFKYIASGFHNRNVFEKFFGNPANLLITGGTLALIILLAILLTIFIRRRVKMKEELETLLLAEMEADEERMQQEELFVQEQLSLAYAQQAAEAAAPQMEYLPAAPQPQEEQFALNPASIVTDLDEEE